MWEQFATQPRARLAVSNWTRFNLNTVHLGVLPSHILAACRNSLLEEYRSWAGVLVAF